MRGVVVLLLAACRIVNIDDPPDAPDFRIVVEPDTVRARLNTQGKVQLDFLVRIFNDGPGHVFVPDCGHEVQREEPNAGWARVYVPPCPAALDPPVAVEPGGTFGYIVHIISPVDSGPWRRGSIAGRYRTISYISAEFQAGGRWGRPVPLDRRISPEFPVREEIP